MFDFDFSTKILSASCSVTQNEHKLDRNWIVDKRHFMTLCLLLSHLLQHFCTVLATLTIYKALHIVFISKFGFLITLVETEHIILVWWTCLLSLFLTEQWPWPDGCHGESIVMKFVTVRLKMLHDSDREICEKIIVGRIFVKTNTFG